MGRAFLLAFDQNLNLTEHLQNRIKIVIVGVGTMFLVGYFVKID